MRTRFLCKDYFSADGAVECLRSFVLLSLPEPCLPPLDAPSAAGTLENDLNVIVEFPMASVIDKLPFDRAVSQFLSDVVPKALPDGEQKPPSISADVLRTEAIADLIYKEIHSEGVGSEEADTGGSQTSLSIAKVQGRSVGGKRNQSSVNLQFEIGEVESFHQDPWSDFEISYKIADEVIKWGCSGVGVSLDMVTIEQGEGIHLQSDVHKVMYLVEDIPIYPASDRRNKHSTEDSIRSNRTAVGFFTLPEFEFCDSFFKKEEYQFTEAFSLLVLALKECGLGQGKDRGPILKDLTVQGKNYDFVNFSLIEDEAELIPEFEGLSLNYVVDFDMLGCKDTRITKTESEGSFFQTSGFTDLEEVQIVEDCNVDCFAVIGISGMDEDKEHIDPGDEDILIMGSLYEAVVSSELCLVDEAFKSLPTPILREDQTLTSLNIFINDVLDAQRLYSISAGDGIYLDWHPLTEGKCSQKKCSALIDSLTKVEEYDTDAEKSSLERESGDFDVKIIDYCSEASEMSGSEKPPEKSSSLTMNADVALLDAASSHLPQLERTQVQSFPRSKNNDRVSSLFENMSQSNDLNFFVNARRGIRSNSNNSGKEKQCMEGVSNALNASAKSAATSDSAQAGFHPKNFEEHQAFLSDHILEIVANMKKIYVAIMKNETDVGNELSLFIDMNDEDLLKFPQSKMMDLASKTTIEGEMCSALIGLCAMKQLAYYLCYFGIHTAHRYMRRICQENEYLKTRFSSTHFLVEDARRKADKGDIEVHSVISIIEDVLKRKSRQNCEKTLIVASEVLWPSLHRKFSSMKLKFYEVTESKDVSEHSDIRTQGLKVSILEALPHSDCFLVSHEQISEAFPLEMFCHILEYGGSCASSRIYSRIANLVPSPQVDFIKVKLDDHVDAISLCWSVSDPPQHVPEISGTHVKSILNLSPRREVSNAMSLESTCKLEAARNAGPTSEKPHPNSTAGDSASASGSVIIVNIQNSSKEMLVSRRSSYRNILELEKDGFQVVERELILPVDLLLNASVCLMWYDAKNVRLMTAEAEGGPQIPQFMETLATSILMSVSFAFRGCILIFEGESSFLEATMEFSDALYAAAASLDMRFQLFCSYSPESTDEIVHACISNTGRLNKGLYPGIKDSETLAESFLTGFPSINTLSAHSILACSGTLMEFLLWSFDERIQALRRFHVPEESIALFSHLSRYGELGESKSVTTECSSVDSDLSSGRVHSRRKRQFKSTPDLLNFTTDDCKYFTSQINSDSGIFGHSNQSNRFQEGTPFAMEGMHEKSVNSLGDGWGMKSSSGTFVHKRDSSGNVGGRRHLCEDMNGEVINWNVDFLDGVFQTDEFSTVSLGKVPSGRTPQPVELMGHANVSHDVTWETTDHHYQMPERQINSMKNVAAPLERISPLKRYEDVQKEKLPIYDDILDSGKRRKVASNFGGSFLGNGDNMSSDQEGTTWTARLFDRIQANSKNKQNPHRSGAYYDPPSSSKSVEKYSVRRSPSIIDSYRYRGGCKQQKTSREKKQSNVGKATGRSNRKNSSSSAMAPSWTPTDKRARVNLSFTRYGQEKQSKLVWTNRSLSYAVPDARKRPLDDTRTKNSGGT
ncbi:shortage in chiasmata 1 [Wolffia australiana]